MNYWLVKSEPDTYHFDQLVKDKNVVWDGVRNYAARNNLRAMKKGDRVLFYHSNEGKEIVGLAKVSKEYYKDPTSAEDWSVVELAPLKKFKKTITLETIKAHKILGKMEIVRLSRLSVTPVKPEEFEIIAALSESF
jgi:predicted RNA-binding protein with PUA-like domain